MGHEATETGPAWPRAPRQRFGLPPLTTRFVDVAVGVDRLVDLLG